MFYVIGDIHGMYDPLKILIGFLRERVDAGEKITGIVFLGDYIDCGPSVKEVLDAIISLRQEFPVITLLGNHEEMLLSFYHRINSYLETGNIWLNYNGGIETIRSLYPQSSLLKNDPHPGIMAVSELLQLDNILKLDPVYTEFFSNLQASHQITIGSKSNPLDMLFSHSVPSPRYNLDRQLAIRNWKGLQEFMQETDCSIEETLVWNRQLLTKPLRENLVVVHGHTPTRYYRQMTRLIRMWEEDDVAPYVGREKKSRKLIQIDIDTGLIYGNSLTMLAVDDSPEAENPIPYFLSVDPKRGYRKQLYYKQELQLL